MIQNYISRYKTGNGEVNSTSCSKEYHIRRTKGEENDLRKKTRKKGIVGNLRTCQKEKW